ncbi:MAG: DUF1499 domain-containing protein [Alphaproteobacteria bacterium]|nr:DUF1499 domain-containing protein [Alphaproteobacteria bacterium]
MPRFGRLTTLAVFATLLGAASCSGELGIGDVPPVVFERVTLTGGSDNRYLVCPADLCARTQAHRLSPEFPVAVDRLRYEWEQIVAGAPRTAIFAFDPELNQVDYVQRSRAAGFPDVVTVRFLELGATRSTLAIYSRSIYGRSDFGVNRRRIEEWLQKLTTALATPS